MNEAQGLLHTGHYGAAVLSGLTNEEMESAGAGLHVLFNTPRIDYLLRPRKNRGRPTLSYHVPCIQSAGVNSPEGLASLTSPVF